MAVFREDLSEHKAVAIAFFVQYYCITNYLRIGRPQSNRTQRKENTVENTKRTIHVAHASVRTQEHHTHLRHRRSAQPPVTRRELQLSAIACKQIGRERSCALEGCVEAART